MSGKKRSHSRRRGETSATEDSSEDSESSTDDDRKAKKAKAKDSASRSRHFDGSRSGTTHDGSHRSTHKEKRKSKHTKKVSKDRKSKRKKSKGAPERLEGRDVPLHQAKELKANKQSCMAFISSTRIAPTAVSHSSSGEKRRPSLDGAVEKTQQSSSGNDTSETPRSLAPMSKEDYDRKRNTIRRVVDPETGRTRLIRGEGEVLEEIVSRDRHKEINKSATRGDGQWFMKGAGLNRLT